MKVVAIIQARMNSSRLPGKVMLELNDMPVLGHVVGRVKKIVGVDEIVVATTTLVEDDEIINYVSRIGVETFRGDEKDVLNRYYDCASQMDASVVVRITADCPLIDPEISDLVVSRFLQGDIDYVSNYKPPTFPDGLDTEVFSIEAIEEAQKFASRPFEREHVTPYIWQQPDKFRLANIIQEDDRSGLCWTLDSPQDLEMMRSLASRLDKPLIEAGQQDLVKVIDSHPEIAEINGNWIRSDMLDPELME